METPKAVAASSAEYWVLMGFVVAMGVVRVMGLLSSFPDSRALGNISQSGNILRT